MRVSVQGEGLDLEKSVNVLSMVICRKAEYRPCKVGSCGEKGIRGNSLTGTSVFPLMWT